jgi:flagellar assembly protein FliH
VALPGAPAAGAVQPAFPAAQPAPSAEWTEQQRRAAYEQGMKAGRDAAQAALEQRAQTLSRDQAQLREATAQLQREQKELQQQKQAGERQAAAQRESLQRLLQQLPEAWEQHLRDAEDDMLVLVFETLCRIVGEQAVSSEGARAMLQRTVQAWHGRRPLSVHVHPDDLGALQSDAQLRQILSASGFATERQTLRWVADPDVQMGGCRLRSEEGALDARLEVQLQAVRSTLSQARQARRLAQPSLAPVEGSPFQGSGTAAPREASR